MPAASSLAFTLSAQQACLLHLHAQGLLRKPARRATPQLLLDAIGRMQMLQIDTIHVVARSPYLTLFARVGAYAPEWLDALLADGRLAECWAHEACFVPSIDYALHRACQALRPEHWAQRHARRMHAEHAEGMRGLLQHIRTHGQVRSADFERGAQARSGWWEWKPEKRWLEAWFVLGQLMVARRERFQRVYDLSERVRALHPAGGPAPVDTAAVRRLAIVRSVRALGVSQARWIGDYFRLPRVTRPELEALVQAGELLQVEVRGWEAPGYVHRDHRQRLELAAAGRLRATHSSLLSPFDPVVWDRARARSMFGFSYTLECYVPAARRQYGYFVLPILRRGRLLGRVDAKAHRAQGMFEIKALFVEAGVAAAPPVVRDIAQAIARCAAWHGTPRVRIARTLPPAWGPLLRAALRDLPDN